MKFKKLILIMLVMSLGASGLFAQKMKRAVKAMEGLDYQQAITLFNQVLEKDDNSEAKILLAECYRKVSNSEDGEYWYGQVVRLPESESIHKLFYGQMLQRNGKCDLAKEWYEKYVEEVPDDLRGQYLVKACDYEDELMTKNAGIYEIVHLPFNSNVDDFSPVIYGEEIIFASERDMGGAVKRTHTWTGNPFLELYKIKAEPVDKEDCGEYTFGAPKKFSNDLNGKFHDAAVAFNQDQSEIYFTRNNQVKGKPGKSDDGIVKLKIYHAPKKGDKDWGDLEGLPFNSDEYSVAHPTLTPDNNTLYFSSDMPGGFGGMDLYKSEKESGSWGPPLNLGPGINTKGNEVFPNYDATGKLYFSSDGQIGLGGLDIYFMEDKGEGEWGMIENVGYPINTISDDFGVVFNEEGTCGFLSSDREGGSGMDDIYSFKKIASPVEILVYDRETKEPIEGASVVNDCTGLTMTTDAEGKITIDQKMGECCNFAASAENYSDNEEKGCTTDIPRGEKVFVEIPLDPAMAFELEGVVFDDNTGLPLEGATVTLMNDCDKDEQTYTTDALGTYNFKLDKDCCYTVRGSKSGYIAATVADQCTRGEEKSLTLQANLNLQPTSASDDYVVEDNSVGSPYKDNSTDLWMDPNTNLPADGPINGRLYDKGVEVNETPGSTTFPVSPVAPQPGQSVAYLLHIYYDFDQSYLRDEAEPQLQSLQGMLENNPEFVVEIGSHTDSRGSNYYNRALSQRRADSVVRWLVANGIDRERLVAVGYGESQNVNNCKNQIPCSEREHQLNRRTEFRILGNVGDVDAREISQPKEDPRVDECIGCPF